MRATGLEPRFHERGAAERGHEREVGDGGLAAATDRAPAVAAVADDRLADGALALPVALDEREVLTFDLVVLEQRLQVLLNGRVGGDEHEAGRLLVEPMHGQGTTGDLRDEREYIGLASSRGGHGQHARRLVDDDEAAPLEHDRRVPTGNAAREARVVANGGRVHLARPVAERNPVDAHLAGRERPIELLSANPLFEHLAKCCHDVLYPPQVPERPDLEYLVPRLDESLRGAVIVDASVQKPVVVRVAVPGDPKVLLVGRSFVRVERHGAFVAFSLAPADLFLAIHPMLAGRFWLGDAGDKRAADTAVTLALADGRELRYRDDKQMGKFWLVDPAKVDVIPRWGDVGVDVLSPGFDRALFGALAKRRKDQVKLFLLDHAALDHLGNAYADEALWTAGIHPKTRVNELDAARLDALHAA